MSKKDIQKACHLYKKVSCIYNQFAKNNLEIFYKKGFGVAEQNYLLSAEYFREAVKLKQDALSKFNLANLMIDEAKKNN